MYRLLDLFSGIGGFSLGLERSGGFKTVAFCEIDPFCRKVLRKHWPDVPQYEDVRELTAARLAADGISVDAICGGFPCQDTSKAGRRLGLDGGRSGLWSEYARIIGELRPRNVIVENTPGLLSLGMGRVLGDLAALGYDAEWHVISASAIGAQHLRERVWIIANPHCHADGRSNERGEIQGSAGEVKNPQRRQDRQRLRAGYGNGAQDIAADTLPSRLSTRSNERPNSRYAAYLGARTRSAKLAESFDRSYWRHQPLLGRGVHGVSNRVDRIGALGNAVVPLIPELIGRAILQAEAEGK